MDEDDSWIQAEIHSRLAQLSVSLAASDGASSFPSPSLSLDDNALGDDPATTSAPSQQEIDDAARHAAFMKQFLDMTTQHIEEIKQFEDEFKECDALLAHHPMPQQQPPLTHQQQEHLPTPELASSATAPSATAPSDPPLADLPEDYAQILERRMAVQRKREEERARRREAEERQREEERRAREAAAEALARDAAQREAAEEAARKELRERMAREEEAYRRQQDKLHEEQVRMDRIAQEKRKAAAADTERRRARLAEEERRKREADELRARRAQEEERRRREHEEETARRLAEQERKRLEEEEARKRKQELELERKRKQEEQRKKEEEEKRRREEEARRREEERKKVAEEERRQKEEEERRKREELKRQREEKERLEELERKRKEEEEAERQRQVQKEQEERERQRRLAEEEAARKAHAAAEEAARLEKEAKDREEALRWEQEKDAMMKKELQRRVESLQKLLGSEEHAKKIAEDLEGRFGKVAKSPAWTYDLPPPATPGFTVVCSPRAGVSNIAMVTSQQERYLLSLDLAKNTLSNVGGIEDHPYLLKLSAPNNDIVNADALSMASAFLTHVNLSGNTLMHCSGLARLHLLTHLDLSHNSLRDLPDLSPMVLLQSLNIGHNAIATMAWNAKAILPCLRELDMSFNSLTGLPLLTFCPLLTTLYLQGNRIADAFALATSLSPLASTLENLFVAQNPLVQDRGFKEALQLITRNLDKEPLPAPSSPINTHPKSGALPRMLGLAREFLLEYGGVHDSDKDGMLDTLLLLVRFKRLFERAADSAIDSEVASLQARLRPPRIPPAELQRQHKAATKIQAMWRGVSLRRRLNNALDGIPYEDGDEFAYEGVDLSKFEFDEASLDADLSQLPPEMRKSKPAPKQSKAHADPPQPLRPRPPSAPKERPSSGARKTSARPSSPSRSLSTDTAHAVPPEELEAQRRALTKDWRSEHASAKATKAGEADLPSVRPPSRAVSRGDISSAGSMTSKASKVEEIQHSWGFSDKRTAELMRKRAKHLQGNPALKALKAKPEGRLQLFKKEAQESEAVVAKPSSAPVRRALSAQKVAQPVLPALQPKPERNKSAPNRS